MAGGAIGREAVLAYNTGTFASPTWTTIPGVIDLSYDIPVTRGDLSSRRSLWQMEGKALQGLEVTFGYRLRQGVSDSVFTALRGYGLATTKFELAIADGVIATTGTQYLRGTFQMEMGGEQPLTDGMAINFTAFLTLEEDAGTLREPAWTQV